jgi:hypothetical protein
MVYYLCGVIRPHRGRSERDGSSPRHVATLGERGQDRASRTHSWGRRRYDLTKLRHLGLAAHTRPAPAVLAEHEVAELALDLGPGSLVLLTPRRVQLGVAGFLETVLVSTDTDRAPVGGGGAAGPERAAGAGLAEVSHTMAAGLVAPDRLPELYSTGLR